MQKKSSFTLVELMVAVSILSIGIVAVLRSFLNSQDLLDAAQNKLAAIRILDTRMSDLEQKMKEEAAAEEAAAKETASKETAPKEADSSKEAAAQAGQQEEAAEESVALGNRKATLKTRITFSDETPPPQAADSANPVNPANPADSIKNIRECIELTLSWKEGAKDKDEVLAEYFEKKK